MSVLTLDIGNSRAKYAFHSTTGEILEHGYLGRLDAGLVELSDLVKGLHSRFGYELESIVYSSVKNYSIDWYGQGFADYQPVEIKSLMNQLPFVVDIQFPETLGSDRLAGVMGCMFLLDKGLESETRVESMENDTQAESLRSQTVVDFLMIDAGTCVTYDYFLAQNKAYVGGAISPGLKLRYKAMADYTDALPMLSVPAERVDVDRNAISEDQNVIAEDQNSDSKDESIEMELKDIGRHTVEAMDSGVLVGFIDEISCRIDRFKEKFVDSQVFLTGGDADFLGKRLKSGIFVEPMLLHYGLFYADQFKK
jgi:type III pantothenate kinase